MFRKQIQSVPDNFLKRTDEMLSMLKYAKDSHSSLLRLNSIMQNMIVAAGGYIWQKNLHGQYVYCDPSWCRVFFKMDKGCNYEIEGCTDKELLDAFRADGRRHSFGNVCLGTDQHCLSNGRKMKNDGYDRNLIRFHYVEIGYIDDKIFVLDVMKTPFVNENGEIEGTVGLARDMSGRASSIIEDIKQLLTAGKAEIVFKDGNEVAAYYIYDNDGIGKNGNDMLP